MRWLTYFILAYLALGLQLGLGAYVRYQGAAPNLVLLAVIFIAINAPRDPALLGCFVMGLMQDLVTQEPLGLYALSYGITAMFVVSTQQLVYREHPLTHFSMALAGGLIGGAVMLLHGWIHPPGPAQTIEGVGTLAAQRIGPTTLFTSALYTAVLAPLVLGVLQRIKRLFAFEAPRRKVRV